MVHSYWPEKIKKQKFNDVYVLLKHSDFCSGMPEMHSKRPRFKKVLGGRHAPRPSPLQTRAFGAPSDTFSTSLFLLYLLQSFCHLRKTLLKTLRLTLYLTVVYFGTWPSKVFLAYLVKGKLPKKD